MENKVRIFDVKHYAVHDGPGIRTTFFLMGCPLRCLWCQNPESQKDETVITFTQMKCIGCGKCVEVCGKLDRNLQLLKASCEMCGKCVKTCFAQARQFGSTYYTPEDVLKIVKDERIFFDSSKGGVTFSGGECMLHIDFLTETVRLLKENGIRSAIDTCGAVPKSSFERILPYADLYLYDIKKIDPALHKEYTGMDNTLILENLKFLTQNDANIIIRIPLIPGYTDSKEDIDAIGRFVRDDLNNKIIRCELLPYNKLAASKYGNKTIWSDYTLGDYPLPEMEPQSKEYISELAEILKSYGIEVFSESL
ncbi:MAG: glycyl-radical enzyme activating protein [Lachnospiraceae bacterium]|nr:glycyl-radical enzyme activating protein [Lachnospiraceae bacterium]